MPSGSLLAMAKEDHPLALILYAAFRVVRLARRWWKGHRAPPGRHERPEEER